MGNQYDFCLKYKYPIYMCDVLNVTQNTDTHTHSYTYTNTIIYFSMYSKSQTHKNTRLNKPNTKIQIRPPHSTTAHSHNETTCDLSDTTNRLQFAQLPKTPNKIATKTNKRKFTRQQKTHKTKISNHQTTTKQQTKITQITQKQYNLAHSSHAQIKPPKRYS